MLSDHLLHIVENALQHAIKALKSSLLAVSSCPMSKTFNIPWTVQVKKLIVIGIETGRAESWVDFFGSRLVLTNSICISRTDYKSVLRRVSCCNRSSVLEHSVGVSRNACSTAGAADLPRPAF